MCRVLKVFKSSNLLVGEKEESVELTPKDHWAVKPSAYSMLLGTRNSPPCSTCVHYPSEATVKTNTVPK